MKIIVVKRNENFKKKMIRTLCIEGKKEERKKRKTKILGIKRGKKYFLKIELL